MRHHRNYQPIYTDRQEFIDYYYNYAIEAIERRAMSSMLSGQRRIGKTEIFKRVVKRLFFEHDHTYIKKKCFPTTE